MGDMVSTDKVNILIVDDLPEKRLVLTTVLEELGENLVTAQSGEEALRCLLHHDFAVILLDVNMPGGISGLETAAMIRRRSSGEAASSGFWESTQLTASAPFCRMM